MTGVVTQPINGARDDGVEGFFKGLGKGAVGLVARPTAGLVDFASGSFGAVKRATELSDEVTRQRARRLLQPDGVVRPFSTREAEGNRLLKYVLNCAAAIRWLDADALFVCVCDLQGGEQRQVREQRRVRGV